MRQLIGSLPHEIIVIAVLAMAASLCWMLVKGFRTGHMYAFKALKTAERETEPIMFWVNAAFNVFWLVMIAMIVPHLMADL